MKHTIVVSTTLLALLFATGCDRKSAEAARQISELERKASEATERQLELERQLEDQRIARERDAIERERMEIEDARAELERQQDAADADAAEQLRQREQDLAAREGKVDLLQRQLEDKEDSLEQREDSLDDKDRELAGREAIAMDDNDADADPGEPVGDYGTFYDSLSPYGSWLETPDYGYVWQPVIVRDLSWRPYTRGRWVCTNRGWNWISDEPFGWATYHYGRWALCRGYGWVWVPGCEWAPSWVCWRTSGTHIGWAPLPPETLAWRDCRWGSTVDVTFGIGATWFNFVEIGNFCRPIHHHCLPYTQNDFYHRGTVNVTNIYVRNHRVICGGPSYGDIARQTKRRPPFYRIEEDRHPALSRDPSNLRGRIEGNRLIVRRPNLDAAWNSRLRPDKVKGRMDSVSIERQHDLSPEISRKFLQDREENRQRADATIAGLGGRESFNSRRLEQLEANRRQMERRMGRTEEKRQTAKTGGPNQDTRREENTGVRNGNTKPPLAARDLPSTGLNKNPIAQNSPAEIRRPSDRNEAQSGNKPTQAKNRPAAETAHNPVRQTETARQDKPRPLQRREESAGQAGNPSRITPPRVETKRATEQDSARAGQRRDEQAEANRRQQEAQRGREQLQRQQQESQRQREQQRQQEARQQQQREQARQQQMEEARREQARQQQAENARREQQREQARQQQMEEARREQQRAQARQQQFEEARQRQQEAARQESARQQQEQSRREQERQQQERSRQDQQRQDQQRQEQQRQEEDRRRRNR